MNDCIDLIGFDMDDYMWVDFNVCYEVLFWLCLFVCVENVFDEDYEEVLGFIILGLIFVVGVFFF